MNYDAKSFSDLAGTPLGKKLWELLESDTYVRAMEVATKLGKPAVAGVGDDLLAELGEDVCERRVKQMCGHMVRQILEARGYVLDAQSVPIKCDQVFVSGSKYKKATS